MSDRAEQILEGNWESGEVPTKCRRNSGSATIPNGPLLMGLHRCTTVFRKRAAISAAPLGLGKVPIRSRI